MRSTYLVTGGAGFIGAAWTRRLVKEGYSVRVFDNLSRGHAARLEDLQDKIEFIKGDIRDKKAVLKAMRGVKGVFHLAFINGTEYFYSKPELVLEVGVKGIVNILDGCLALGVREIILVSSSEVYQTPAQIPTPENVALTVPDPLNPRYSYAAGKIISEIMTLHYGRKYFDKALIIRPHNVYGPDMGREHVIPQFAMRMQRLMSGHKKDPVYFPIQGSGKETRSFIYIDDFVEGFMRVFKKGRHRGIYHIGTQDEVRISRLAALIASFYGRKIKIIPGRAASGGTQRRCPDISKLCALGFRPKISLSDGVNRTMAWYDTNRT